MSLAVIAFAWIMVLSGVSGAQDGNSERQFGEQLTQTIAKVRTGESPTVRRKAAEHLAALTRKTDAKKVDDTTVADLVSLLDTSDDSVLYWVARCLGNLGSRANIAIPKLQKRLAEVDCLQGSKTSASGVRYALSQLGVPPSPPRYASSPKPQ
jgi:hypothetical protein